MDRKSNVIEHKSFSTTCVVDGKQICSSQTSRHIEVCPSISLINQIRLLIITFEFGFFTSFFETKKEEDANNNPNNNDSRRK